jgi:hypothetical protein
MRLQAIAFVGMKKSNFSMWKGGVGVVFFLGNDIQYQIIDKSS